MLKLPAFDPAASLSQAITYSTGGVSADGNGFFHPLGDHAQAAFVIDGQPISDQQSKLFSTQLPVSAIQSMEVTTGTPDAEFGDKSSLIAQITTRSGLGAGRWFGNIGAFHEKAGPSTLPQGGYDNFPSQEQDDHNPDRVTPRHVFNLGIGSDNLTHAEGRKRLTAEFVIVNLTNKVAAYNFLSTFSGTHFLQPRTFIGKIGLAF